MISYDKYLVFETYLEFYQQTKWAQGKRRFKNIAIEVSSQYMVFPLYLCMYQGEGNRVSYCPIKKQYLLEALKRDIHGHVQAVKKIDKKIKEIEGLKGSK